MELYYEIERENFTFLHAREVSRNEGKWREGRAIDVNIVEDRGSMQTKNTESNKYISSSSNTCSQVNKDPFVRVSMSQDASKRKGKKKESTTQSMKFESVDELMEKQYILEMEKLKIMKHYMSLEKDEFILELLQLDTSTLNETQKQLYEQQMQKFLDD